jgi:transcriptional/translational regulatory protein YebC/TACO1
VLTVRDALRAHGLEPEGAEATMRAMTGADLGEEDAGKMVRLLDMLEDLDDVQQVYSNADISDEVLARL